MWYLDDGTVGGSADSVKQDLEVIKEQGASLGLSLNESKSEVICDDPVVRDLVAARIPGAKVLEPSAASLLGAPIGNGESVSEAIQHKLHLLHTMGERLHHISAHDALLLLRNSFAIPKLLYLLRSAPSFLSTKLEEYDTELRSIVSAIANTKLDDTAWSQASLPVKAGGLGIRSDVHLAPSAFLSSTSASKDLVNCILPPRFELNELLYTDDALEAWAMNHNQPPPQGPVSHLQRSWDSCRVSSVADALLEGAQDELSEARLLATSVSESGAWLNALPISSLGLRMDDETVRVAVGLRLGTSLCHPHSCYHCGVEVDSLGTHGLSCRRSEGRHHRHSALNDIVQRALTTAHIPSRLEPTGVYRSDGKRPDGISVVPWQRGKLLVWDATCSDTFAPSYLANAASGAGLVAEAAESRKIIKYSNLARTHHFVPVAIETTGVFGPATKAFVKELGHRLRQVTGDEMSHHHLVQRLSVAIQRGNCASVLGTCRSNTPSLFG